jgi:NitT/TauT family transport system ATP-binding protein
MSTTPAVTTRDLGIGYGSRLVARIQDLALDPGTVWLVTGPNGSGKTTLLKTLAGLLAPVSGVVSPAPRRGGGATVFCIRRRCCSRVAAPESRAQGARTGRGRLATEFGLADRLDRPAHELSHGMRQRAAIARAILARPAVLLLDEPEGGLDQSALAMWRAFVERVIQERTITLVIAAHRPAGLDGLSVQTIEIVSASSEGPTVLRS